MFRSYRLIVLILTLFGGAAQAADYSDTWIGYRHGKSFREPFDPNDIEKNIISINHFSTYSLGSNFLNIDLLNSVGETNPATGGGGGAHNIYAYVRTTLSGSKILAKSLAFGPIRDIGLTGGFEWGVANDQFAGRTWKLALGPKLSFDVPGALELALLAKTESNHNWFATSGGFGTAGCTGYCRPDVRFKTAPSIEVSFFHPFNIGIPVKVQGFGSWVGRKGRDGLGQETKPETLIELQWLFDLGSLAGKPGPFQAGVGYQYWKNKYGNDSAKDTSGGSTARVPQLLAEVHF